jgi:hypothetical protein
MARLMTGKENLNYLCVCYVARCLLSQWILHNPCAMCASNQIGHESFTITISLLPAVNHHLLIDV